jgi:hypothetical protein
MLPDFCLSVLVLGDVGISQSVQSLTTGWTTERLKFESRYGQEFSLLHVVQTCSGDNPACYPMGTWSSFPGGKVAGP